MVGVVQVTAVESLFGVTAALLTPAFFRFRRAFVVCRLSKNYKILIKNILFDFVSNLPEQVFDQRWCKIVFKQSRGEKVVVLYRDINSCIGSSISHN